MAATRDITASAPLHERAFREFLRAGGLVKRAMEPYFARFGISGAQWGVLRTLHRAEAAGEPPPRLTDLSDLLLIRPPSVCGVVDRLERFGLVERLPDSGDQRSRHVRLTRSGRRLVSHILAGHSSWMGSLMSGLSPGEQSEFLRLLRKFGAGLDDAERSVAPPNEQD
jgi:DNA-binding MarR family transcriptional regulator